MLIHSNRDIVLHSPNAAAFITLPGPELGFVGTLRTSHTVFIPSERRLLPGLIAFCVFFESLKP